MSQFNSRFQSTPPKTLTRDTEIKLRTSPSDYAQDSSDSAFARRRQETQKIKNLSFWENTDQEVSQEQEWTQRQSPTPFILVMIILVVAVTVLWFLYKWASGDNSNTPPIIAADTAPFKIRPENPGGMMIPHQDKLIYGRLSQNPSQPIERLLPPPEQPLVTNPVATPQLQQQYPQAQNYNTAPQQGYAPTVPSQGTQLQPQLQQGVPQFQQGAPQLQQGTPQPQQVIPHMEQGSQQFQHGVPQQSTPYHPYQTQAPYPPSQQPYTHPQQQAPYGFTPPMASGQPTPHIPPQTATDPSPPKHLSTVEGIKPAQDEEESESKSDDAIAREGHNELDQLIAKEAETPLKKTPKKNAEKFIKQMPIDASKHKVQIASLPSRPMAEQEMKRLMANHRSVFGNKPWNIQKINLGPNRGYTYRLIVGSFANHSVASKFCKKLQGEKIGCMVIAPAG